jgi:2,3-bisphosphoglycerate-dependent phosphoglycerate mutase
MKNVYLVRHGESETNAGDKYYGPSARLTALGHRQAEFLAQRCAKLPVEIIISSGFPRADETAEYVVRTVGKPFEQSALFTERRPPTAILGQSKSEPDSIAYEDAVWSKFGDPSWRHSDAENFEDLNARAKQALAYLAARPEQNILVVGHGFFTKILAARVIFGEKLTGSKCLKVMQTFRLANTGLSVFEYDPGHARGWVWRIAIWNDQAHLADVFASPSTDLPS